MSPDSAPGRFDARYGARGSTIHRGGAVVLPEQPRVRRRVAGGARGLTGTGYPGSLQQ
jgi:hypothetical protein